jgi:hypothetical protein
MEFPCLTYHSSAASSHIEFRTVIASYGRRGKSSPSCASA